MVNIESVTGTIYLSIYTNSKFEFKAICLRDLKEILRFISARLRASSWLSILTFIRENFLLKHKTKSRHLKVEELSHKQDMKPREPNRNFEAQ